MNLRNFQRMLDRIYPGRNMKAAVIKGKLVAVTRDSLGNLTYSLQGRYSYEEVKKLNQLTTYSVRYGYCPSKGPVAIIGIPNPDGDWRYFEEVVAYGEITSREELEFMKYSDEDVKRIESYTVYGLMGIEKIADLVKFDKINAAYDSRSDEVYDSYKLGVLKMKCKLQGQYSSKEVEIIAKEQYWTNRRGVSYATLESGQHVAIISFEPESQHEGVSFRDVWESGKTEPPIQKITFMTNEDAASIKDFSIYLYDYRYPCKSKKLPSIIKIDRTFAPGFDFYDTPDGKDLRLSNQF